MAAVDIKTIPEPFREFLANEQRDDEKKINAMGMDETAAAKSGSQDMQDMLFLAAILLLTDD